MRSFSALLLFLGLSSSIFPSLQAQTTCTGLCLQQVTCPAGQTTSISGTVYAPNGVDPLPNVLVYIPNAPVDPFTPGVSCPVVGTPPSGSPLVGTNTSYDGTFTLGNVPVGSNIPLVIETGRWRRQITIATTTACADTALAAKDTHMPKNKSEGDIPLFAIATGSQDQVECILRKVGIDDAEFTNPGGGGRIHLFSGSGAPGARIDTATPSQNTLMGDPNLLNQYDVLMLPCQGQAYAQSGAALSDFTNFANAGGRVYASHFAYVWMNSNPPFDQVVNWQVNQSPLPDGTATVDTSFAEGKTLSQWLQLVGATTTPGQMPLSVIKHDLNGVKAPTQSWLTLNNAGAGNPVMQFVFNTPVTAKNQCGRVLFNEYHVENPATTNTNRPFPTECTVSTFTPQEKLLEYSLFELTNDGSTATLTPLTADFGTWPIAFSSTALPFTWTNNSTFPATVSLAAATGDFSISRNGCTGTIATGASCTISVIFTPTALGARTGVLSVGSGSTTLTAALTGTGVPALSLSPATQNFGSVDVGATTSRTLLLTNSATAALPFPALVLTGDYSVTTNCTATVPAMGTCNLFVVFKPTATGPRPGTLTINAATASGPSATSSLTGNGVDFTISVSPTSGSVIAGYGVTTNTLVTPIAGFANGITLSCNTNATASTCTPRLLTFTPSAAVTTPVVITTISQFTVIGFAGGYRGVLGLVAFALGGLLWHRRRNTSPGLRATLTALLLTVTALTVSGCSGKQPAQNSSFTAPGTYTYTLTATDGFLTHSATYSLTVTTK